MASLYADEDFSYPVVQRLRQLGHDIVTAQEAGQANQGCDLPYGCADCSNSVK